MTKARKSSLDATVQKQDGEFSGESLIFLISQPRAGSTLLQRMLATHSDIYTTSEPWLMLHPLYALREKGFEAEYNSDSALGAVRDFLSTLPEGEETYWEALRRAFSYLYDRALAGTGKKFFLDKTPRYYFTIPELYRVFPKAKFIFLLRNPLAVLASILETWVKDSPFGLSHFRHDLLTAPRRIAEGTELLKSKAIVVHYEKLVKDPETTLQELCDRLGITFHPEMVEYGQYQSPKWHYGDQRSVYQHSRPVVQYADKWVKVLSRSRMWQQWARGYLHSLGPDLVGRMGYSYEELEGALSSIGGHVRATLIPWNLAIKAPRSYSLYEKLWVRSTQMGLRLHRSLRRRGAWGTFYYSLCKLFKKNFPHEVL